MKITDFPIYKFVSKFLIVSWYSKTENERSNGHLNSSVEKVMAKNEKRPKIFGKQFTTKKTKE